MRIFKDAAGGDWSLAVNVASNKRVKALTGFDLFATIDQQLYERLRADPELLVNVLYALCKPEADARKVSDEDFGALMVGDAIDRATTALTEDLADFFPQARRELVRKAMTKVAEIEAAALGQAIRKIDAIDVGAILRKAFGDSSTTAPASAGSTPTP